MAAPSSTSTLTSTILSTSTGTTEILSTSLSTSLSTLTTTSGTETITSTVQSILDSVITSTSISTTTLSSVLTSTILPSSTTSDATTTSPTTSDTSTATDASTSATDASTSTTDTSTTDASTSTTETSSTDSSTSTSTTSSDSSTSSVQATLTNSSSSSISTSAVASATNHAGHSGTGPGNMTFPLSAPYPPTQAALGGLPTTKLDVPPTAIFLVLFVLGAVGHMIIMQKNRRRSIFFAPTIPVFAFCMCRTITTILRICWATQQRNLKLAIAAEIFVQAGIPLLFIINLIFAQRIVRACCPRIGWTKWFSAIFKIYYAVIVLVVAALITVAIQSFYTLDQHILDQDHTTQDVLSTFLAVTAFLPIPLLAAACMQPGGMETAENFGAGKFSTKIWIVLLSSFLLSLGAFFRAGTNFVQPLQQNPAWFDSKACFYLFNFTIEIIIVFLLLFTRADKRFHVPNGSSKAGDYSSGRQDATENADEAHLEKDMPGSSAGFMEAQSASPATKRRQTWYDGVVDEASFEGPHTPQRKHNLGVASPTYRQASNNHSPVRRSPAQISPDEIASMSNATSTTLVPSVRETRLSRDLRRGLDEAYEKVRRESDEASFRAFQAQHGHGSGVGIGSGSGRARRNSDARSMYSTTGTQTERDNSVPPMPVLERREQERERRRVSRESIGSSVDGVAGAGAGAGAGVERRPSKVRRFIDKAVNGPGAGPGPGQRGEAGWQRNYGYRG